MEQLLKDLPAGFWLKKPADFLAAASRYASVADDAKRCQAEVQSALAHGKEGRAAGWLALGLVLQADRFLARVRREGTLRPSKYPGGGSVLRGAVATVLDRAGRIGLGKATTDYLGSIEALAGVAKAVQASEHALLRQLRSGPPSILKALAVTLDVSFRDYEAVVGAANENPAQSYTPEELADGFSYLYNLYAERMGLSLQVLAHIDTRGVHDGRYRHILQAASELRRYREWEIQVDMGTHRCERGEGGFRITVLDERNEKALRLSYIQTSTAKDREKINAEQREGVTLEEFADRMYRVMVRGGAFRLLEHPVPRVTLSLTEDPKFWEILRENDLFKEEGAYFANAMQSYLAPYERLVGFEFPGGVTVGDLMKVSRLFTLMRIWFNRHLAERYGDDPALTAQSTVAVYTAEMLRALLSHVVDGSRVDALLELLTWRPGKPFDVQYQPLMWVAGHYMVPPNVLGMSDLVRNSMQLTSARMHADAEQDPAERMLESAFEMAGIRSNSGVKYKWNGTAGEIDVVAYGDGILFGFECKNSLLPASPFELRTTFNHLAKAADQMDRLRNAVRDPLFLQWLEERTGLPCTQATEVVTGIISANRMFSGGKFRSHPVRGLLEIGNLLLSGEVVVSGRAKRLIHGERATPAEVRDELMNDTLRSELFDLMIPLEVTYTFSGKRVTTVTFALDSLELERRLAAGETA